MRYEATLEALGEIQNRRILDVGCGAGRYTVEFARRGAEVVGVDFSEEMIRMARERAVQHGVADRITFLAVEFLDWAQSTDQHFDVSLAMGFFDYTKNPREFLRAMAKVSDEIIASFPSPSLVRAPLRKLRYWLRNCPVYSYRKAHLLWLAGEAELTDLDIRRIGRAGHWLYGRARAR